MSRLLSSLVALALVGGCEDPVTTTTLTDEGTACINDDGDVQVTFPGCLSSSCDTLVGATCEAVLVSGVLEVHAEATIESQGTECTADCGEIVATCAAPLIEDPETVTISYAGVETPLAAGCEAI